jgi:hypothetical protein
MGTYWNNDGRLQKEIDALTDALVPAQGKSATREGEMLSAAAKLQYEFYNNGGGNNVSGAMFYLAETLPDFKSEWRETLQPFVTGAGRLPSDLELDGIYSVCESIIDAVGDHVISQNGVYSSTNASWRDHAIRETGFEHEDWDLDLDEDDDVPAYSM